MRVDLRTRLYGFSQAATRKAPVFNFLDWPFSSILLSSNCSICFIMIESFPPRDNTVEGLFIQAGLHYNLDQSFVSTSRPSATWRTNSMFIKVSLSARYGQKGEAWA